MGTSMTIVLHPIMDKSALPRRLAIVMSKSLWIVPASRARQVSIAAGNATPSGLGGSSLPWWHRRAGDDSLVG